MIPIEYELEKLTKSCYDMFDNVVMQLQKCQMVVIHNDIEIAEDVVRKEIRINALELNIERDCENILALKTPVATDLRFVIAILKISENLERIGDHVFHMAEYVLNNKLEISKDQFDQLKIEDMFKGALEMMGIVISAMENKDSEKAKVVFKKDKVLDKITSQSPALIEKMILENKSKTIALLHVFRIIGKLERIGDLIKNIAEEIIFYIESETIRHKKRNKKIFRTYIKDQE